MQRTLIINRQFVKTNTCFPLFSYTFFSIFPIHTSNLQEILGKDGLGLLVLYTFFQSLNPNFSTFWRKWSWTPPGWISICDSLCAWAIHPLSEGLVTAPLGVEKLSPRFKFFGGCWGLVRSEIWRPFHKNEKFLKNSIFVGPGPDFHIWA